jgi:hypothetical protein
VTDEMRKRADELGYVHYRCNVCGWSGWTDGDPRGECYCGPEEDEGESDEDEDSE